MHCSSAGVDVNIPTDYGLPLNILARASSGEACTGALGGPGGIMPVSPVKGAGRAWGGCAPVVCLPSMAAIVSPNGRGEALVPPSIPQGLAAGSA